MTPSGIPPIRNHMNPLEKKTWTESDWTVYFRNLRAIQYRHGILQKDMSRLAGVQNLYRRKDVLRPGKKALLGVSKAFGVSPEWLVTDHSREHKEMDFNNFIDSERAKKALSDLEVIERGWPAKFDWLLDQILACREMVDAGLV